jgi:GntR family transcriptional regulator
MQQGIWSTGMRVPPEPELAATLGVSRATLREALRGLEEDGLITRRPSAGTYVTRRPRLSNNLDVNFGVSDLIRSMGMTPGTSSFRLYEASATEDEAEAFGVTQGVSLAVVERIRTADGTPVVFSRDYYPVDILNDRSTFQNLGAESLYDFLERKLGMEIQHGIASIQPAAADHVISEKLGVPRGTLLLYLRQTDYDSNGMPVLLSKEYHLAEAFQFTVVRRGPRPAKQIS